MAIDGVAELFSEQFTLQLTHHPPTMIQCP